MRRALLLFAALALSALLPSGADADQLSRSEFNQLKKQIAQAATDQDHDALAQALRDVGKDDSKRGVNLILATAVALPDGKVLAAATDALSAVTTPEAIEAIVAKVEKKGGHVGAKILCIDALAALQPLEQTSFGEVLGGALSDRRPEVVRAALRAVRQRRELESVPSLIDLYEKLQRRPDALLLDEVTTALVEITGKWFETVEDWRRFYELTKDEPRPTTGDVRDALTTAERQRKRPKFFGTEIKSDHLVFVIDTSGSMEGSRIQACKEQLSQCIEALGPQSTFTIISFASQIKVWQQKLQPATPANKAKAKEFVAALEAKNWTYTLSALKESFQVDGADAIVLLSDGIPTEEDSNGERIPTERILEEVDGENRFKKWRIDTFGFLEEGTNLGRFLKDLSKAHGGTFTPIGG